MLTTISQLLLALSAAAQIAGVSNPTISKWASIAAALLEQGDAARAALEDLVDHIRLMVDEDREPTQAEWDALAARSQAAHDTIQNWSPDA